MGFSILESYSRVLESLAFTVMSRIEDVLRADALARGPPSTIDSTQSEVDKGNTLEANNAMTLSDFMGWQMDQDKKEDTNDGEKVSKDDQKFMRKPLNIMVNKKFISIFKLETCEA